MRDKVFVSGCFDMFHSGHVQFLEKASRIGDVYVGVGSDKTVEELKRKTPVNNQEERLFMVSQCKYVKDAFINKGSGILDFKEKLKELKPKFFFVNEDGDHESKRSLCEELGIFYVTSQRDSKTFLPKRSTTSINHGCKIPYRIDLGGGWLDQDYVNKIIEKDSSVITICVEPEEYMEEKCGFSTSTRNKAIDLWGNNIPSIYKEKSAKILFSYENLPGSKKFITGSQDAIGICYPGLNKINYHPNTLWPYSVESITDESILNFLEDNLRVLIINKREFDLDLLSKTNITKPYVNLLARYTEYLWNAIMNKDLEHLGIHMKQVFLAQCDLFPLMMNETVSTVINKYSDDVLGYKLLGCGGGGALLLVTDKDIEGSHKIKIRR